MDELAQEIGVQPQLSRMLVTDPGLALRCFFGPCVPAQYRLQGPGNWSGAKDVIKNAFQNTIHSLNQRNNDEINENCNERLSQGSRRRSSTKGIIQGLENQISGDTSGEFEDYLRATYHTSGRRRGSLVEEMLNTTRRGSAVEEIVESASRRGSLVQEMMCAGRRGSLVQEVVQEVVCGGTRRGSVDVDQKVSSYKRNSFSRFDGDDMNDFYSGRKMRNCSWKVYIVIPVIVFQVLFILNLLFSLFF